MALKHYLGRDARPAEAPWTCPSCGTDNTTPLKAGCQKCGAGADARTVGVPEQAAAPLDAALAKDTLHRPAITMAEKAFYTWCLTAPVPHPNASVDDRMKEAFMAGVLWAQGNAAAAAIEGRTPPPSVLAVAPEEPAQLAILVEGGVAPLDAPSAATILAALAFYRDNQLNYGAVPGQLTAQQVDALITRLTPEE